MPTRYFLTFNQVRLSSLGLRPSHVNGLNPRAFPRPLLLRCISSNSRGLCPPLTDPTPPVSSARPPSGQRLKRPNPLLTCIAAARVAQPLPLPVSRQLRSPIRKLKTGPSQRLPVPAGYGTSRVRGREWSNLSGPGRSGRAV